MFDKFVVRDVDGDGDPDFYFTRGNSRPFDGVFWLEQTRAPTTAWKCRCRHPPRERVPVAARHVQ
jgi:hypothetical protein